jgi:single-strand DNA-binding protein
MANYNKVLLMGNLTRDVEVRFTASNTAVANIGLAVNRRWRNQQSGEMQEETTFVDCEAWGRQAETLGKFLRKGRPVFIEGRLRLDQWQDKDGGNRSKLKVVIESFEFIDSKDNAGGGGGGNYEGGGYESGGQRAGSPQGSGPRRAPASMPASDQPPMDHDDIPF